MRFPKILFTSLVLLGCHSFLCAQSANGKISGIILDTTSGVIPGAEVLVINDVTHIKTSTRTNAEGIYALPNLPPGPYRLQVSKVGFKTVIKPDILLNVQDALSINFTLPVGAVSETVTVESGAPMVNTTDGSVSTIVDRQFVENIPLNGRSFQSLIQLAPGVVLTKTDSLNGGQFSVNGQRADANYFSVDGVSANIGVQPGGVIGEFGGGALPGFSVAGGTNNLVSVDAMQEFRIQTSTYAPEFGRSPGAQVQIATRSGTNQFHGTAFDYLRNNALDANNWFNGYTNHPSLSKPKDRQNDFGGVFGGPLWKDRTFFFFSYEGLRLSQPVTTTTQVPSQATRQNAAPQMQPFLDAFPIPNGPNSTNGFAQFTASFSNPSTLNATSLRIDHSMGKITIFARYNYAPSNTVQRAGTGSSSLNTLGITALTTQTATLGATWSAKPTVSNDLRFNWSTNRISNFNKNDTFGGAASLSDALLFPSFTSSASGAIIILLSGGVGAIYQRGENATTKQRQLNIVDSVSVSAGSHQLKFGADYRRLFPLFNPLVYSSVVRFNGATGAATGLISGASIIAVAGTRYPIFNNYSTYVQDTWKISNRLTLTYGLRWDINPAPHEKNGNQFTVTGLDNPSTLAVAPQGTSLWNTTYRNVAPRFGAAYELSQLHDKETMLRGGVGIFYDLGYTSASEALGSSWPFTATKTLAGGVAFPFATSASAPPSISFTPSQTAPASNFFVAVPNLQLPRTYEWNFAIEQSLGLQQALTVSYIGALGQNLLRQDILFRPNPNFANVNVTRNSGESNYQAMQVEYDRRLSRRVQALASYTWSHSLDNASSDISKSAPAGRINLDLERGSSDFDIRHSLSAALTYNLPAPAVQPIVNVILRNWALDAIYHARSATPVNISTGTDVFNLGTTSANSRPDIVSGVPLYIYSSAFAGGKRFNPAAFSNIAAGAGRQGTLGRNALRGFPLSELDFTARREVKLTERLHLQFRAEFFNLLNQPNFADPINNLSSGLFGQSTQTLASSLGSGGLNGGFSPLYQVGGPRSTQLALRLLF